MQDLNEWEDASVDVVVCCYGIMFPADKVKALSEVHRVLKPGGKLIATYWLELVGKQNPMGSAKTAYA